MKTRCGIVIVLVALAALLFASVPAAAPASVSLNSYEQQLVNSINKVRTGHHLASLRVNARLVDSARFHSAEMGAMKYFDHNSPTGETWSRRIVRHGYSRSGYSYYAAGENIFKISGTYAAFPQLTVSAAVKAWMNSPAHRAVILFSRFRDIGVGAVTCGGTEYVSFDVGRRIQ